MIQFKNLTSPLIKYLYNLYYASGKNSPVLKLYYKLMRSPSATKLLFKMKVLSAEELSMDFTNFPIYFGLNTVLLKWVLNEQLRPCSNIKILEIGVGAFAVLSGYLSRRTSQTIDAIDIDPVCVKSAQKHIELNRVNVRSFQSDLFSNLQGKYDLIFWNLPTESGLNPHLEGILHDLFLGAPDFMNESAQLIIVYNSRKLPRDGVLNILSNYRRLHLHKIKKWWWNINEVMLINSS